MNITTCIENIKAISTPENFWEQVREIIGFYKGYCWSDHDIKRLQRVADSKFESLTCGR